MKTKKIKFIVLLGCLLCLTGCGLSTFQTVALSSGLIELEFEIERQLEIERLEIERQNYYNENKKD